MTTRPDPAPPALPASYWQAAARGLRGRCPRCDGGRLFGKWLKPVDRCGPCGQDWVSHRADDFPPYIAIFITGHLLAPVMILMIGDLHFSPWAALAILLPLALAMMLAILQPAKGGVLATMWWTGMMGPKERPEGHPEWSGRE